MDQALLQSLAQYNGLKKPALKRICIQRGLKPTHSVTELIAQLRDHDDGLVFPPVVKPFSGEGGGRVRKPEYEWPEGEIKIDSKLPNRATAFEKWTLQSPIDHSVDEDMWAAYNTERARLVETMADLGEEPGVTRAVRRSRDKLLSLGARYVSGNMEAIPQGLYIRRWEVDVESAVPQEVKVVTRWYSPLGIGNSVDLWYDFDAVRSTFSEALQTSLVARFSTASELAPGESSDDIETYTIFKMHYSEMKNKHKRINASLRILNALEEHIFATKGVIPPHTLYEMLLAAGTVLSHKERNEWVRTVGWRRYDHDPLAPPPEEADGIGILDYYDELGYLSTATDKDALEEAMGEQRRNAAKVKKSFLQLFGGMKRPDISQEQFLGGVQEWIKEAVPIVSDSEDMPSEPESESEEDEDNEWETEGEDDDGDDEEAA